jgi:hypothetical protein
VLGFFFFPPPAFARGFCFLPSCWLLSNVVCTFFPRGVLAVTFSLSFSYLCIFVFLRASCFVKCVFPFVCFFAFFFFFFGGGRVFLVDGSFCVSVCVFWSILLQRVSRMTWVLGLGPELLLQRKGWFWDLRRFGDFGLNVAVPRTCCR